MPDATPGQCARLGCGHREDRHDASRPGRPCEDCDPASGCRAWVTPEPPAGRSFEDMLADPGEQFDPRSELLASIAAYAAAPSDTPSATPPRPLTAPDVVASLLADVADARAQLAEVTTERGRLIDEVNDLVNENAQLQDVIAVTERELATCRERNAAIATQSDQYRDERDELQALIDAGQPTLATELLAARDKLDRALAANQRWAETLGDVQQRHAEVKRERDDARSAFAKLAGHFTQGAQSGWTARISGTVLRRLCAAAGCEPPDGSAGGQEPAGEYPPVPVPPAARVTLDDLAAAIGRCMPRIRSDIERADGWIAAHVEDPRDYAWGLLQQCAGWDPDAEMPSAGPGAP